MRKMQNSGDRSRGQKTAAPPPLSPSPSLTLSPFLSISLSTVFLSPSLSLTVPPSLPVLLCQHPPPLSILAVSISVSPFLFLCCFVLMSSFASLCFSFQCLPLSPYLSLSLSFSHSLSKAPFLPPLNI